MFFIKFETNMSYHVFICKSMFLTSMILTPSDRLDVLINWHVGVFARWQQRYSRRRFEIFDCF